MVAYFGQQIPDEVPEWAMERARKEMGYYNLGGYADHSGGSQEHELARYIENRTTKAFARYIMKHEDAPVDPSLALVHEWLGTDEACHSCDPDVLLKYTHWLAREGILKTNKSASDAKPLPL